MLLMVQIDLSNADLALFEAYEAQALALLGKYGARLEERLRSVDAASETHLLFFPNEAAFRAFRADPDRAAIQDQWIACGAGSRIVQVERVA